MFPRGKGSLHGAGIWHWRVQLSHMAPLAQEPRVAFVPRSMWSSPAATPKTLSWLWPCPPEDLQQVLSVGQECWSSQAAGDQSWTSTLLHLRVLILCRNVPRATPGRNGWNRFHWELCKNVTDGILTSLPFISNHTLGSHVPKLPLCKGRKPASYPRAWC